jgi:hypothetical protein
MECLIFTYNFIEYFIGYLDNFLLISHSDIVSIYKLNLMLKIIGQCDFKHIMMIPMKTMASVLKVSTYIITCISAFHSFLSRRW